MKYIILIIFIFFTLASDAQEYINPAGLERFSGTWRHISGYDTITFKSYTKYVGGPEIYIKGLVFYYDYKRGTKIILSNIINYSITGKGDYSGTRPSAHIGIDTLKIAGRDKLKRKKDEGYLIINVANNQLTFKRDIGIFGGGLSFYKTGEESLSGYTLPDVFILNKVVISPGPIY